MPSTTRHLRLASRIDRSQWPGYNPDEDEPESAPDNEVTAFATADYEQQVIRERNRRKVRTALDAEGWQPPPAGRSLADAREAPPVPPVQIIDGMVPQGVSDVAGQFKAGKTTLGLNLAYALGSGEPFLGAYEVDFPDGSISYWNLELDESMMYDWQDKLIKSRRAACRIITENLRGYKIDLTAPVWQDWAIKLLMDTEARAWIIDPKGRMLKNENDNSEYNDWFGYVEMIAREADLDLVVMFTHTGHASAGQGNAIPRSRGASAQMGNTDANLSYRHGGDIGSRPPDDRRYLSGFGRGIDLEEITLTFDRSTGLLRVDETSRGRSGDKAEREADDVVLAIASSGKEYLASKVLEAKVPGNPATSRAKINAAIASGKVRTERVGHEVRHYVVEPGKTRITD